MAAFFVENEEIGRFDGAQSGAVGYGSLAKGGRDIGRGQISEEVIPRFSSIKICIECTSLRSLLTEARLHIY